MKAGWQIKKLGSLCQIELGKTPARADKSLWDEKRQTKNVWLSIADLLNGEDGSVYDSKEYLSDKGAAVSKIVPRGTLLASFKLTLGRLAFAGRDLYTNEAIAALSIHDEKELSKEFLYYFLHFFDWTKAAENDVKIKGMTLNKAKLKEMLVHFPAPSEQHRIVALLDAAFDGIATARANAEKNLQNARALFESHLQKVFTQRGEEWIEKRLGDVFTTATGTTPPKSNADFYGDFIPLVKPPELCNELIDSASDGLSEDGAAVARLLPQKSILVSCIGNLGKVGLNTVPVAFNQQINAILPDESHAIPEFMFFQTLAPVFKEQLESLASGTTVPIVNKSKFNSVGVVLPPLPIQRSVAAQFSLLREETQRLESLYQRKLAALDELKQSLLHQALIGHLL